MVTRDDTSGIVHSWVMAREITCEKELKGSLPQWWIGGLKRLRGVINEKGGRMGCPIDMQMNKVIGWIVREWNEI